MTGRRDSFSKLDVTVTLSGEEWFAVLSRIAGRDLSLKGAKIYNAAAGKLQTQILAASCASLQQEGGEQ